MDIKELWRRIEAMAARKSERAARPAAAIKADEAAAAEWRASLAPVDYVNAGPSYMEVQAQREIDVERGLRETI
jgi:hypothetical protein